MATPALRVMTILGIRPDFIRMSEIIKGLDASPHVDHILVHTGQHYSFTMDQVFFQEMGLREPDHNCGVGSGTHGQQTGRLLIATEELIFKEHPDICFFLGDANPCLAAISAAKCDVKIARIEGGMRSFDWRMPEEKNRIIVDHISDYLYVYTHRYKEHVLLEGIPEHKIFVVGNPIVDIVNIYRDRAASESSILERMDLTQNRYVLVTLHRQENVDNVDVLKGLIQGLDMVGRKLGMPVYYPMSYRTEKRIQEAGLELPGTIRQSEPLGFIDFLKAEQDASLIITDSGTVQEEASILRVPCLVARRSTERPETIEVWGCVLAGTGPQDIAEAAEKMVGVERAWEHLLGDGLTSKRIVDHLVSLRDEIQEDDTVPPYVDRRKRHAFSSNYGGAATGGGWERPRPSRAGREGAEGGTGSQKS